MAGVLAALLIARYFAGLIQTTFSGYGGTFNPIKMIQCSRIYGFPKAAFGFIILLLLGATAVCVVRYLIDSGEMDHLGRRFRQPKNRQGYGDAHFEQPHEYKKIARITSADKALGVIVGQLTDDGSKVISTRTDNNRRNSHMAVVGASGSGKSFTFSLPFAYQTAKRRESIVITDPDGGLYRQLAGFFIKQGYVVKSLNLKNLEQSNGWHCLKSLENGSVNLKADIFAKTVINNIDGGGGEGIYSKGPMELLKALILRVYLGTDFPPERKNIREVYNLLCQNDANTFLDNLFTETGVQEHEATYLKPWRIFINGSANLKGNIITNLGTDLQILQSEEILTLLSTDDIDLALPGDRPCAYFCQFPDDHDAFQFVESLFFSMLFQTLIEKADAMPDGKLKIPVNFLLDEFPSIGVLPDWDRKMATIRKRNINVTMIFQDITQLQNNYDRTWVTLLSNCSTWVCLGINDEMTAQMIQRRIGQTTIEVQTEQHPANEPFVTLGLRKKSVGEGKRDLLSIDELQKMDEDHVLILFQGHNPIYARKFPHILHPSYQLLCEDPFGPMPRMDDIEGRKKRAKLEREYLELYDDIHARDVRMTEEDLDKEAEDQTLSAVAQRMAQRVKDRMRWDAGAEDIVLEFEEEDELVLDLSEEDVEEELVFPDDEPVITPTYDPDPPPKAVSDIPLGGALPGVIPLPQTMEEITAEKDFPSFMEASPEQEEEVPSVTAMPEPVTGPIRIAQKGEAKEWTDTKKTHGRGLQDETHKVTEASFVQIRSKPLTNKDLNSLGREERRISNGSSELPTTRKSQVS